jgi:hypothetical protein
VGKHTALLKRANVHASDARPSAWADTAKVCLDERVGAEVRGWLQGQFSQHDRLVIKDPRLLWFLPLWNRVGSELDATVNVITVLRHPAEVVSSKSQWYSAMDLAEANRVAGWVNTMLFTERATRDYGRAFVRFEELLEDWTQPIARISAQLDIPTLVNARARDQVSAASLVDSSLRRSTATWEDLDASEELVHLAERVWEDLLLLADPEAGDDDMVLVRLNGNATLARLDKHREEYASFYRHAEHVAQSTTLAATRPLKQKVPPNSPSASSKPAAVPPPTSLNRARRLIPAEVRRLMPPRLKRALFELFG